MGCVCYVRSMPNRHGTAPEPRQLHGRVSNSGGKSMSVTFESAEDSAPGTSIFATVNDGVPHFWIPDLDANCHTLSDLADAFTRLAVAHGDAIFDYCDCDASGAYFAFRIPWQGR